MLATVQVPTPPDAPSPSLADLSRRASVISTSSSDDATTSEQAPVTPQRPRPIRTFTGPRSNSPMPSTPRGSRPPTYLTRDLGLSDDPPLSPLSPPTARSSSRAASRTRGVCIDDFETHGELGEGAYSTVSISPSLTSRAPLNSAKGDACNIPSNETQIRYQNTRQRSSDPTPKDEHRTC